MLCVEGSTADIRLLALGRGKIAKGWEALDAIRAATAGLLALSYRHPAQVGSVPYQRVDTAVDVIPDRIKLPAEAATVALEEFLVDPVIRQGYLEPATLERAAACTSDGGVRAPSDASPTSAYAADACVAPAM